MRRRTAPRPFAPALERVAERVMPQTLLAEVQRVWTEAAGAPFGTACEPVAEHGGKVTVRCGSAVLASELDLMSGLVIERLNAALGRPAVHSLRADARPPQH